MYLLTCNHCRKQYAGKTTDCLRYRGNNYDSNNRKFTRDQISMQNHLCRHFDCEDHIDFLESNSINLVEKTDGEDPKKQRKKKILEENIENLCHL